MSQRRWKRLVGALTGYEEPVLSAVRASAKRGGRYVAGYLVLTQGRLVFFCAGLPSVKKARAMGVFSVPVDKVTGIEGRPVTGDATSKLTVFAEGVEHSFLLRCSQMEAESFASGLSVRRLGRESYGLLPMTTVERFRAGKNGWWMEIIVVALICGFGGLLWLLSMQ